MEQNETNAKKAYETVVEVLKGMDNVDIFHRDGELIAGNIYDSPEQNAHMFFMTISKEMKSIELKICITENSISNDHYIETLFASNMVNECLPDGLFVIKPDADSKQLEFRIASRYNFKGWQGENVDTVLYMIEKAQTAISIFGDRFIKLANGEVSLNDFFAHN